MKKILIITAILLTAAVTAKAQDTFFVFGITLQP